MDSKTLSLYFLMLILCVYTVQGLRIHKHHNKLMHKSKWFYPSVVHKLYEQIDREEDTLSATDKAAIAWLQEEDKFINSNPDIMDNYVNSTPLSTENAQKFKDFQLNSKAQRQFLLLLYSSANMPQCLRSLSDDQKGKIFNIQIEQTDFVNIFKKFSDSEVKENQQNKDNSTIEAIKREQSLGEDVAKCYSDHLVALQSIN